MEDKTIRYALRPDAQAFDEIILKTVPRYKSSGLSGSEWRVSAKIEFWRKGKLIHTTYVGNIEVAAGMVYAKLMEAQDNAMGYFAGDGETCDQEGCSKPAQFLYRIKQEYCVGGGNCGAKKESYSQGYRCFCSDHKTRGDQDLEDNDDNYELVLSKANVE